jgi:hypothetical protein
LASIYGRNRSRAAVAAALYASQITRAKRFCPVAAANAAAEEANFGTCRSAATVRYLSRATHELGALPDILWKSGMANLLPRRDRRDRKPPGNIAAPGANIESRQAMLGEEKDERHAPAVVAFVAGIFAGHFVEPNFCMTYVLQDLFL